MLPLSAPALRRGHRRHEADEAGLVRLQSFSEGVAQAPCQPHQASLSLATDCTAVMGQKSISRSQTLAAEEGWAAFVFKRFADSS
jgi:hypothetical protein